MKSQQGRSDAELVEAARRGDKECFGELIARYQNLVGAISYSVTRSLGQSEEVAQEAFINAWSRLHELRNPDAFRGWLRHIAQNLALNCVKRRRADPVELVPFGDARFSSLAPSPLEFMITREQEVLLRRALRRVPRAYRVPLVLYYRENKSIEKVAEFLDLTENNVKQRLLRGRRILQQQVEELLEHTLGHSRLGKQFTAGVLAAIVTVPTGVARATPDTRAGAASHARWSLALKGAIGVVTLAGLVSVGLRWWRTANTDRPADGLVVTGAPGDENHRARQLPPRLANIMSEATFVSSALWPVARVIRAFEIGGDDAPFPFFSGRPARCPAGMDGVCIIGTSDLPWVATSRFPWAIADNYEPLHVAYAPELFFSFDYWLGDDGTNVVVQFNVGTDEIEDDCCWKLDLDKPVHRVWGHGTVPMSRLVKELPSGVKIPLERYREVNGLGMFQRGPGNHGFYVANLKFAEPLGRAP